MSSNVTPLHREGGPLTKAQRDLVKSARGVAERVTYELGRALGGDPQGPDRVQSAHLGIAKAAQTYDSALGPFEPWAKLKAAGEILTMERRERKQKRLVTAGRLVGLRVSASRRHQPGDVPIDASDEDLINELVGIVEDQIAAEMLGVVAVYDDPPEGDEDVAEREEWGIAVTAMLRELDKLDPAHREMLLLFAHGHDIKAQAESRGMDYSTLLDQFHRQLALLRARLKGQRIVAVPAGPAGAPPVLPVREPPLPKKKKGTPDKGSGHGG
jgi:DNA-directed RNA polymerase specialized sigma24 family protein